MTFKNTSKMARIAVLAYALVPAAAAGSRATELGFLAYDTYASETVDEYAPSEASIQMTLDTLAQKGRPFILVYRLRALEPQAGAPARPLLSGSPGDDGAAGALLLNTDRMLSAIERKLKDLGQFDNTNIAVIAEYGRATIWKQSHSSYIAEMSFPKFLRQPASGLRCDRCARGTSAE